MLDADDGDIGHELLDQDGDPRSQTAAAHGHEDAVELGVLLNHLQPDGALTGDHPRVVERGDEGQPLGGGQALGLGLGGVEVLSDQADLSPSERTASTLMRGVTVGMTIVARIPRIAALRATPWAWLPAEAVTTPRARWVSVRERMAL